VEKVRDIVGLYLNPPARALVLCVDEKPSIQATEGTAPVVPMRPGQPERHTHRRCAPRHARSLRRARREGRHRRRRGARAATLGERWGSLLQRRALTRAAFASTDALETALHAYVAATNAAPKPFVWTKTADEILASVKRYCQQASGADHR
jgi:hypothetical protein